MITYRTDLEGVDWDALKQELIADDFHNGRTTNQLRISFENSQHVAMGYQGSRCIANGRMLSDGVGNAFVIDVWTQSEHRRKGVASRIMELMIAAVPGQHIYLQTDDAVAFYQGLGFEAQPEGLFLVAGTYLQNPSRDE